MSKKDKIIISRSDDFAEVDEELSAAIEGLDDANARVEDLLREQTAALQGAPAEPDAEGEATTPQEGVAD